jgi:hypothetical protein
MLLHPQLEKIQAKIRFTRASLIVLALVQIAPANFLPALAQDLPPPNKAPQHPLPTTYRSGSGPSNGPWRT